MDLMTRLTSRSFLPALAAATLFSLATSKAATPHQFTRDNVLGTQLDVKIIAQTDAQAKQAFTVAHQEIERLNRILSSYQPQSECSRLSAAAKGSPIKVSPELYQALKIGRHAHSLSEGHFTLFSSELSELWKKAAQSQTLPATAPLQQLCKHIQAAEKQVELHPANSSVTFGPDTKGLSLNLNAVAKGMIIDASLKKIISSPGVISAMVNIGGDIACGGKPHPWPVSIRAPKGSKPIEDVLLQGDAIATSGHYHRFFNIKEQSYSHIIDARSGAPVNRIISSTVIAPTAAEADMLATVLCLVDAPTAMQIIQTRKNCQALVIDNQHLVHRSAGWKQQEAPASQNELSPVEISFEQAFSGTGKKSKRHYTIIWVENQQGEKVKDILLWHKMKKRKYLKSLKSWWGIGGKETAKDLTFLKSVSEATKRAGQYSTSWDHTDNAKQALPRGKYSIHIEVNREDGPGKERPTHLEIDIDTRQQSLSKKASPAPEIPHFQVNR